MDDIRLRLDVKYFYKNLRPGSEKVYFNNFS